MPATLVTLHLCVNNPRNGAFAGICRAICLDDPESLTLDSPYFDRHLKCAIDRTTFRLGKNHTWQHHGYGTWAGNWCWDTVDVTPACAADVLNFAVSKGYRPEVGAAVLWDKIDRGENLTGLDLMMYAGR